VKKLLLSSFIAAAVVAAALHAQTTTTPPSPGPQTSSPGQPAPPVAYTVDVALVEVDAVVTDNEGRAIRDLRREDFQLFEDGKPQTIDRVSFVEIPIDRAEMRGRAAPQPDVRSNVQRFEGRLYVLLLDDLHTAAPRSGRVREAARRFVEEGLKPGDLAAVVHVSGAGGANQDFTTDRRLLLASIDRFGGRQLRSETLNKIDDYNRQLLISGRTPTKVADVDEGPRAHDARSAFETIAGIARRLAPVRGRRKALLWFGEGVAYDMFASIERTQASLVRDSARNAVSQASAANVAIYGMDARGLGGMGDEALQLTSPPADPTGNLGATGLGQELLRSQDNLRRLSSETGGFAVTNTDELAHAFDRVVNENSAYYLLGYYPSADRRDGAFHRIEVRVNRPGVRVRARSGYIASDRKAQGSETDLSSGAPAALRDALVSPVPISALPMSAQVAPFRGERGKASVLVTVEYAASAFAASAAAAPDDDRLNTSVVAVDPAGKVAASDHSTVVLNVKPETRQAMRALGFRTHSRLELPPGRYQVRVAALHAATGLVGSVYQDVEVPDFSKAPLSMSALMLTSVVSGYTPTARLDERMRGVLPAPPATTRDFRNDEAMALFAEIYHAEGKPSADIALRTQIRNAAGAIVFDRDDVRTPDEMKRSRNGYSLQLSLRQLPPGDYVLRLEAVSQAAGSQPVVRDTAFQVWEVPASEAATPSTTSSPSSLPFVAVAKGALSGVAEPRQAVARNDAEWQALWRSLLMRGAQPAVIFENTMIVAVFLGSRPTAGYEPQIVGVRLEGDILVVQWREQAPPDAGNPPAVTTPFVVAGVPQHAGEVRFEKVGISPDRE
jgi:VWFA-related protein